MKRDPKPIDPARTAVLVIEFQREWMDEDGKLNHLMEDRPQFEASKTGGKDLLKLARAAGLTVIHSGLRFTEGHAELGQDGLGLRGAIKSFGTFPINGKGSDFAPGFEPLQGEFVPTGRLGGSAFAGSNLGAYLQNSRIVTLLIAGYALHVCVESTLRAAHDLGYDAYLIPEATAAFTASQRAHVLDHVVHHYGLNLSLEALQAQLG